MSIITFITYSSKYRSSNDYIYVSELLQFFTVIDVWDTLIHYVKINIVIWHIQYTKIFNLLIKNMYYTYSNEMKVCPNWILMYIILKQSDMAISRIEFCRVSVVYITFVTF